MKSLMLCLLIPAVTHAQIYKCGNTFSDQVCPYDAEIIELQRNQHDDTCMRDQ